MRALTLVVAAGLLGGCVIKDEIEDGIREVRPSTTSADLRWFADGSGQLDFVFHYELGIVDDEGIAPVMWTYQLVDPETRQVLAETAQRMRKPDPDKTQILVEGDRTRSLEVPPGRLEEGRTYVLWFTLTYRDEPLGEHLASVEALGPGARVAPDPGGVASDPSVPID